MASPISTSRLSPIRSMSEPRSAPSISWSGSAASRISSATSASELAGRSRSDKLFGFGCFLLPAARADQRHESDVAQFFALVIGLAPARHADQALQRLLFADGNDQSSADGQLIQQRLRNIGAAGGDDDRIEGRVLRPTERAVAVQHVHVVETLLAQSPRRLFGQFGVPLDRVDLAGDSSQDRRGVAGAGADFQHAVLRLQLECLGHQGHDVGLRNGLPLLDRQGPIEVGKLGQLGRQERFTRHRFHRGQHRGIGDAAAPDLTLDCLKALLVESNHGSSSFKSTFLS